MAFIHEGKEISPCIVSKMKHALGLKEERPANKKQCTEGYWQRAAEAVGKHYGVSAKRIVEAAGSYADYVSTSSKSKSR